MGRWAAAESLALYPHSHYWISTNHSNLANFNTFGFAI